VDQGGMMEEAKYPIEVTIYGDDLPSIAELEVTQKEFELILRLTRKINEDSKVTGGPRMSVRRNDVKYTG